MIIFHITRLVKALGYSSEGLLAALKTEPAFALEVILCLILIPVAIMLPLSHLSKAILIGSLLLVLIVELLNSAVEATVDRISADKHPLAKKAKDLGSAAVLLSVVNAFIVWVMILI